MGEYFARAISLSFAIELQGFALAGHRLSNIAWPLILSIGVETAGLLAITIRYVLRTRARL